LSIPSRTILLSPGRTGSVSIAKILDHCSPSSDVVVLHEHPLARCLIPLSHLQPAVAANMAGRLAFPQRGNQCIRVDPLLSYCGVRELASRADLVVFVSRSPVAWVESMARKIRFQKLFPLIRSLPILRPPAPSDLLGCLKANLPAEHPYLLGLLAAYVGLHRKVNALPEHILQSSVRLHFEQLYGNPGSPAMRAEWQSLFAALGWTQVTDQQLFPLLHSRHNSAPVRLSGAIRDPQQVSIIVQGLIQSQSCQFD